MQLSKVRVTGCLVATKVQRFGWGKYTARPHRQIEARFEVDDRIAPAMESHGFPGFGVGGVLVGGLCFCCRADEKHVARKRLAKQWVCEEIVRLHVCVCRV